MKIALCYSGLARSFEKTFDNHKRALIDFNDADADIFAHFWEPKPEPKRWIVENVPHKKIIFEKPKNKEFKNEAASNVAFAETPLSFKALSMFYGVEKSINLALEHELANSIKYDFIFRMRTDLFFLYNTLNKLEEHDSSELNISPSRLSPFDYDLSDKHLLAQDPKRPSGYSSDWWEGRENRPNPCPEAIDDRFAFSNREIMEKYSNLYSNYGKIVKQRLPNSPECLLGIHIKNNKLDIHQNAWRVGLYKGGDWSQTEDGRFGFRGGFKNKQG